MRQQRAASVVDFTPVRVRTPRQEWRGRGVATALLGPDEHSRFRDREGGCAGELAHLTSTVETMARELRELRALVSTCMEVQFETQRAVRQELAGALAGGRRVEGEREFIERSWRARRDGPASDEGARRGASGDTAEGPPGDFLHDSLVVSPQDHARRYPPREWGEATAEAAEASEEAGPEVDNVDYGGESRVGGMSTGQGCGNPTTSYRDRPHGGVRGRLAVNSPTATAAVEAPRGRSSASRTSSGVDEVEPLEDAGGFPDDAEDDLRSSLLGRERSEASRNQALPSSSPAADPPSGGVCVVCLEATAVAVFYRCGHMCCCMSCATALFHGTTGTRLCPCCRAPIKEIIRAYGATTDAS